MKFDISMSPSAIITRPQPDSDQWVQRLQAEGIYAHALPLITIIRKVRAIQGRPLSHYSSVMFVSSAAAQAFFAASPHSSPWPPHTRAWATGPATASTLLHLGIPQDQMDSPTAELGLDSEGLWSRVSHQARPNTYALIVMGSDRDGVPTTRGLITQRLRALGVHVDELPVYARHLPQWSLEQKQQALEALQNRSVWTFTSSESVSNLAEILPEADFSRARAAASHPRVVDAAVALGFGEIALCASALYDDMKSALHFLLD